MTAHSNKEKKKEKKRKI